MRAVACVIALLLAATEVAAQSHEPAQAARPAAAKAAIARPVDAKPVDVKAAQPRPAAKPAEAKPVIVPAATPVVAPSKPVLMPVSKTPAPSTSTAAKPLAPVTPPAKTPLPAAAANAAKPEDTLDLKPLGASRLRNPDAELIKVAKAVAARLAETAATRAAQAKAIEARAAASRAAASAAAGDDVDAQSSPRRTAAIPRLRGRYWVRWPAVDERWKVGWPSLTPTEITLSWPRPDETVALRQP